MTNLAKSLSAQHRLKSHKIFQILKLISFDFFELFLTPIKFCQYLVAIKENTSLNISIHFSSHIFARCLSVTFNHINCILTEIKHKPSKDANNSKYSIWITTKINKTQLVHNRARFKSLNSKNFKISTISSTRLDLLLVFPYKYLPASN